MTEVALEKVVFATSNKGKLREINQLMPDEITVLSLEDIHCKEAIPETEPTIEGNARQKAQYILDNYGLPCFADDSGLLIHALNDEPGVYSARYAGPGCTPLDNMKKVLRMLDGQSDRRAKFVTVICFMDGKTTKFFAGEVSGKITSELTGDGGFGYDPIFVPDGYNSSFAQMTLEEKNRISHRGKAVEQLVKYFDKV